MEQVWASPGPIGRRIAHEMVRRPFFWADGGGTLVTQKRKPAPARVSNGAWREQETLDA
jgi:hypothetical protein